MNETDNTSLEQITTEPEGLKLPKQSVSSNKQIANMDFSDYMSLLMESRII